MVGVWCGSGGASVWSVVLERHLCICPQLPGQPGNGETVTKIKGKLKISRNRLNYMLWVLMTNISTYYISKFTYSSHIFGLQEN